MRRFPQSAILTLILVLTLFSPQPEASAAFVKIEDFQNHALGAGVGTANGWTANHGVTQIAIVADPASSANKVLSVQNDTSANVRLTSSANAAVSIPNGTTATLFVRFRFSGPKNYSFGMSDVAAPAAFGDFESQFNHNNAANEARVRDAGAFRVLSPATPLEPDRWHNVWMVINNATDRTTIYLDSTTLPGGTTGALQNNAGTTAFTFRNSGAAAQANALHCFLLLTSGAGGADEGHTGTLLIDDIWLDASGQNLVNPSLPPANLVTAHDDAAEVGVGGWIGVNPTGNDTTTVGTVDPATLQIVTPPTNGTANFDPLSKRIIYRHTGAGAGSDSFRYRVSNTAGASGEADVVVNISSAARLANTTMTIPLDPPPGGALQLVDAFPGLTFDGIVSLASVPGAPQQLIVGTAHGASTGTDSKVWMIPDTTAATPAKKELFEVDSLCPAPFTRGRGIYSLVCHPNFAANGHLFVCYQGRPDGFPIPVSEIPNLSKNGVADPTIECTLRISRFTMTAAQLNTLLTSSDNTAINNARAAILASEQRLINLAEQHLFHSINDAHFGPDGYLYVSFGDEGDQGEPYRNAQHITKDQYSSILRLDVDRLPGNLEPNPHYAIIVNQGTGQANFKVPADNPYAGNNVIYNGVTYTPAHPDFGRIRTEMWSTGWRNPFKFHIDPPTGDVWVGDVGMDLWEEVTVVQSGDDAGWSRYEGSHLSAISHAISPATHKVPEYDYPHATGNNCVIGGVFYRGTNYTGLQNKYIFGDHGSGRLWRLTRTTPGNAVVADLGVGTVSQVVDFHVDPISNNLLIAQYQASKRIYKLIETTPPASTFPALLSQTGIFADLATLTPNPGVVPYAPNLKFWSDHADKSRWFVIHNTTDQVGYSRDGNWTFPEGMMWVKHFDLELNRAFPGTHTKRLETRVLVRNAGGAYGVAYRWNDEGTDATLVSTNGVDFDLSIREGGTLNGGQVTGGNFVAQRWHIPSRGECLTCHNPNAGHALSMNTRQLNKEGAVGPMSGNLLSVLSQSGYLANLNDTPASLPRFHRPDEAGANLDDRVRSYFAVNCSYCHQPNSGIVESWDARGHLSIEGMRLLYHQPLSETYHEPDDFIIKPGDKTNSLIYNRIQARHGIGDGTHHGYSQMPPLATNVVDPQGVQLLAQWIDTFANVAPSLPPATPGAVNLTENALPGTVVAGLAATDPDVRGAVADQAALSYVITAGNPDGLFSLNAATGQLVVNGILDYELAAQLPLTIEVRDNFGANPKFTTHHLTVNLQNVAVEDANGNGLPDWWENLYAPAALSLAGDFDGDGLRDFFAFLADRDPTLGNGSNILGAKYVPGPVAGFEVQWRYRNGLLLGRDYLAEATGDINAWSPLLPAQYQVISNVPDGLGVSRITVFVPSSAPSLLFRLSSPQ